MGYHSQQRAISDRKGSPRPETASVGVVVLTHSGENRYLFVTDSLLREGVSPEAIVVVQNSAGNAGVAHDEASPAIHRLRLEANYGYAAAMNAGIRLHLEAGKEYLLVLTHDVGLREKSIIRMLAAAESHPDFGVFGPTLWWRDAQRAFSFGGTRTADGTPTHRLDPPLTADDDLLECDWVDGAAMLVRSEVFRGVGLFDERFFLYFEETEFCLRSQRAGWRVGVVRDAVVEQSPGGAARPGAYAYLLARNGLEHARLASGRTGVAAGLRRQKAQTSDLFRKTAGRRSSFAVRRESAITLLGCWLGTAAFALRLWGPPPRFLPGLGDVRNSKRYKPRRTFVVSTFPPRRDGIARYASQFAEGLRGKGVEVRRIGFPGSSAEQCVRLDGGLRALVLLADTRRKDELILMWHPEFFITGRAWNRTAAYLALGIVTRLRRTTVIVHEPDAYGGSPREGLRAFADALEGRARTWFWNSRAEVAFHSDREREDFVTKHLGLRRRERLTISEHGKFFRPYASATRAEARRRLGLDDGLLFLCVGFIGRHKGFDRAVRGFAELPRGVANLQILGSLLYETNEAKAYVDELRQLVGQVDGARMEERFLDDDELDLWIQAADAVLAPYRSAASSSVVARARLLGTRVVATDVGGLPEQLGSEDILVTTDAEFRKAISDLASASSAVVSA
jgi:GT2 family glycosyltransferase/glycosyltransferase involved in cell wall biosynthesis